MYFGCRINPLKICKKQESHECWLVAQLFNLQQKMFFLPQSSNAHREIVIVDSEMNQTARLLVMANILSILLLCYIQLQYSYSMTQYCLQSLKSSSFLVILWLVCHFKGLWQNFALVPWEWWTTQIVLMRSYFEILVSDNPFFQPFVKAFVRFKQVLQGHRNVIGMLQTVSPLDLLFITIFNH